MHNLCYGFPIPGRGKQGRGDVDNGREIEGEGGTGWEDSNGAAVQKVGREEEEGWDVKGGGERGDEYVVGEEMEDEGEIQEYGEEMELVENGGLIFDLREFNMTEDAFYEAVGMDTEQSATVTRTGISPEIIEVEEPLKDECWLVGTDGGEVEGEARLWALEADVIENGESASAASSDDSGDKDTDDWESITAADAICGVVDDVEVVSTDRVTPDLLEVEVDSGESPTFMVPMTGDGTLLDHSYALLPPSVEAYEVLLKSNHLLEKEVVRLNEEISKRDAQLGRVTTELDQEREKGASTERKHGILQTTLGTVTAEFNTFCVELQDHFQKCCHAKKEKGKTCKKLNKKLDLLKEYVQERYSRWTEKQVETQGALVKTQEMVQSLSKLILKVPLGNQGTAQQPGVTSVSEPVEEQVAVPRAVPKLRIILSDKATDKDPIVGHREDKLKRRYGRVYCVCGVSFKDGSLLDIHLGRVTVPGSFQCLHCDQRFNIWKHLRHHMFFRHKAKLRIGGQSVACPHCGKVYANRGLLNACHSMAHVNDGVSEDEEAPRENEPLAVPLPLMSGVAFAFASSTVSRTAPVLKREEPVMRAKKPERGHTLNVSKRHLGFYCTCGIDFASRGRLDRHIQFKKSSNKEPLLSEEDPDSEVEDVVSTSSSATRENDRGQGGNAQELFQGRHRPCYFNPLKCICGYSSKFKSVLARHLEGTAAPRGRQPKAANLSESGPSAPVRLSADQRLVQKLELPPRDALVLRHRVAPRRDQGFWVCSCGRRYHRKISVLHHVREATQDKRFYCRKCSYKTVLLGHLTTHLLKAHQILVTKPKEGVHF